MLFQKKADWIQNSDMVDVALGTTVRIPIDRTYPIESMYLKLDFTVTGDAATNNPDAIQAIVQSLVLSVNDGFRQRNVVNISGPGLLEYNYNVIGNLDRLTLAGVDDIAAQAYTLTFPIFCAHPQISDPIGSFLLLPVIKYPNDPVLEVRLATQAQMDVNATPTFAVSAGVDMELIINRRIVNVTDFPYVDWELTELEQLFPATGDNQRVEVPAPGSYTGQLYRGYTSASARGDITAAGGHWRIESLGVVLRRWKMDHLLVQNDNSKVVTQTAARFRYSWFNDFLTDKSGIDAGELGSVLDANIPQNSGARIYLVGNVTGGTAVKLKIVNHRVFGDLKDLKLIK